MILTVRRHVADEEPVLDHRLEVVDERAAEEDHHLPLVHVQQLTLDVELRVEGRTALLGPVLYKIRIAEVTSNKYRDEKVAISLLF